MGNERELNKAQTFTAEEMRTNADLLGAVTKPFRLFKVTPYYKSRVNGAVMGPVLDSKKRMDGKYHVKVWADDADQARIKVAGITEVRDALGACESDATKEVAFSVQEIML